MDVMRPETIEACRGRSLVDSDTGEVVSSSYCLRFASVDGPPTWPHGHTGSFGYHVYAQDGVPVTLYERTEAMSRGAWDVSQYPVHVRHANLILD